MFKLHVWGRGSGKTTNALSWLRLAPDHRALVVMSHHEKMRVVGMLRELDENRDWERCVWVAGDWMYLRGLGGREIRIDNLSSCLQTMFAGHRVDGAYE